MRKHFRQFKKNISFNDKFNFSKIKKNIKPYFIAEAGVNHECSMQTAKKLIDLAKKVAQMQLNFKLIRQIKIASKNSPSYWDLNEEKTKSQYRVIFKI